MSIQVHQIRGDIVELIFNPKEVDLHVGENILMRERGGKRGVIAQIIAFRTATHPSLTQDELRLALGGLPEAERSPIFLEPDPSFEMRNLQIALGKIRKVVRSQGHWDRWDGWIPTRDVEVQKVDPRELRKNCIDQGGNPVDLGHTLDGERFVVEGQALEKVNVITGVKGSGKSYLAKVLLLELIKLGAPCIVFDLNREYIHLPGVIVLRAGEDGNLRMGIEDFGLGPLLTMLEKYGLPEISALYFENRVSKLLEEARILRAAGRRVFLGIDHLLKLAEAGGFGENEVVNNAIRSRLLALKNTGIFASSPLEAVSIPREYQRIQEGGALVFDISSLGNLARFGFVQAVLEIVKGICEREIAQGTNRFPFVFFEEAHLYMSQNTIGYIVTRSRHLGITSFFITNMIRGLDESVLRQVDNLFVMHLPYEDDIRHLGKTGLLDEETLECFVRRLRNYHALVIGNVTHQYPIIFRVKELLGVETAGETKFFFQRKHEPLGVR